MKIIVGLGNPGSEYAGTRHNAGQLLVDQIFNFQFPIFKETYGWRRKKDIMVAEFSELMLVKTAGVFMNESGRIIHDLRYMNHDLRDLYLAHDDLDIKLGEYKIQFGTGPKVHNGVNAIEQALGTKEFWRIRIGIDYREPAFAKATAGEEYVLQRFNNDEKIILNKVLENITHEIVKGSD